MGDHGLELADVKNEVVLLIKKCISRVQPLMFRNALLKSKATVKYSEDATYEVHL